MSYETVMKGTNEKALQTATEAYFKAGYGRGNAANSEIGALKNRIEGIKKAYAAVTTKAMQDNLRKDYKKLNKQLKKLEAEMGA